MTFIVAYVPDDLSHMFPDHLFQNYCPDEVSRTRTRVASVVGTDEVILTGFEVLRGTVSHLCLAIRTIDQSGKHMGLACLCPTMTL